MASTKKEYEDWKQISPEFCILHKLHAEDVSRQFGGLPAPVIMSWHDYDKYIHLNDLCAYDLLLCLLGGPGIRMGVKPFMLDQPGTWLLAIGDHEFVEADGEPKISGEYLVRLRQSFHPERRTRAGRIK